MSIFDGTDRDRVLAAADDVLVIMRAKELTYGESLSVIDTMIHILKSSVEYPFGLPTYSDVGGTLDIGLFNIAVECLEQLRSLRERWAIERAVSFAAKQLEIDMKERKV